MIGKGYEAAYVQEETYFRYITSKQNVVTDPFVVLGIGNYNICNGILSNI